jgi:hypothetical protein
MNPVRNDRVLPHLKVFSIISKRFSLFFADSHEPARRAPSQDIQNPEATKFVTDAVTFSVELLKLVTHFSRVPGL